MLVFKIWKPFEAIWLITFTLIAIFISVFTHDSFLNFFVLFTGILCVVLAAKGNLWNYVIGTVNTIAYGYVCFTNGLFGELGLYLVFFLPMNIVGFFMWKNNMSNETVLMKSLPNNLKVMIILLSLSTTLVLGFLLSKINGQNSPYLDSIATILSIIATILMVLRYKEQWILYIVLNIMMIIIWYFRLQNGSENAVMMLLMWFAFLLNAVWGNYNWTNEIKKQNLKA